MHALLTFNQRCWKSSPHSTGARTKLRLNPDEYDWPEVLSCDRKEGNHMADNERTAHAKTQTFGLAMVSAAKLTTVAETV